MTIGDVLYAMLAVAVASGVAIAAFLSWNERHKKETPENTATIEQTFDVSA